MRLSALFKINDDWNVLIQQNYQNMEADGYFGQYPANPQGQPLGPDQITAFTPAYDKDHYESTAWTLNGRIGDLGKFGDLKLVYTGSYLVRHIQQQADYSNYMTSGGGQYYACTGAGTGFDGGTAKPTTCYAPVGDWNDTVQNTHQSHEFRVSTSDDNRFRALVGAYWEKFNIDDQMNFNYLAIPQCSAANLAISAGGGPDCCPRWDPFPATLRPIPACARTPTRRSARTCSAATGRPPFSPPSISTSSRRC